MIFDPLAPLKCRFGHGTMWRRGCRGDTAGRHERKRSYIIRGPLNDVPLTDPSSGKGPAISPQNRHVENGRNHVVPRRSKPSGRKSTKDKNSTVRIVPPGAVFFVLQCGQSPLDFDLFALAPPKAPKRPAAFVRPKDCFAPTLLFDPVALFQEEAHLSISFSLIFGDVLLPREGALIGVCFNLCSIVKPLFPFDGPLLTRGLIRHKRLLRPSLSCQLGNG